MRYVVLPQAVRRVIPPLLNDFIGLQKDTVLVSFIGVVEIFRTAQIRQSAALQLHALPRRRAGLPRADPAADPGHRLAGRPAIARGASAGART